MSHFPELLKGQKFGRQDLMSLLRLVYWPCLVAALALAVYGVISLYYILLDSTEYSMMRQFQGIIAGIIIMIILWRLDIIRMLNRPSFWLIVTLSLIVLPLLPIIGVSVNGSRSWIMVGVQLQPCEWAKLSYIMFLSSWLYNKPDALTSRKQYARTVVLAALPFFLIMLQPDLGTGLVFIAIALFIFLSAGVKLRYVLATLLAIVVFVIIVLIVNMIADNLSGADLFIKEYQINRILVFLDNSLDPTGLGYNLQQAKIAIGSAGLWGNGLGNAVQSTMGFLPEAPTDFAFCILAEQFGFAGCLLLLLLFGTLLYSCYRLIARVGVAHPIGLIVSGLLGMWLFQVLENIGMTTGLMPITGIPLPFISYGSSSMIANLAAVGMVCGLFAHRKDEVQVIDTTLLVGNKQKKQ